jgi:hypothetical protein
MPQLFYLTSVDPNYPPGDGSSRRKSLARALRCEIIAKIVNLSFRSVSRRYLRRKPPPGVGGTDRRASIADKPNPIENGA